MLTICVFCASRPVAGQYQTLAINLGRAIAQAGHTLLWGGQTLSLMGDVSAAARTAGGRTVGVIPRLMLNDSPDPEADELMVTASLRERKLEMQRQSDAFIALPGGLGTLDEFIEIWTERYIGAHAKPLAVLDPDGLYDPLFDWLSDLADSGFVSEQTISQAHRVRSVSEAMKHVTAAARP